MIQRARRNLVLIGMMGAGKTTVGRQIARRLGRPFVDTDRIIQIETGRSIPELFAERGEEGFRDLESAVIERVAAMPNQIIAVGGGAVCRAGNVRALRATGDIVLLHAPISQLAARVAGGAERSSRPLLRSGAPVDGPVPDGAGRRPGADPPDPAGRGGDDDPARAQDSGALLQRLHDLWRRREALYESAAMHRVDAGHRPPAVIAEEIIRWMRGRQSEREA